MTVVTLNGTTAPTKEALHQHLAKELAFPDWYGGNLDALFDCLTTLSEEVTFSLAESSLGDTLGPYTQRIIKVLQRATEKNPNIQLNVQ